MALSISSCLNHFHPVPNSTTKSPPSQATQLPWKEEEKERSWKRQCIIGVACVIIVNFPMENLHNFAWGMQQQQQQQQQSHHVASLTRVQRWSDKRSCPPWRLNSLETIVPENLPRPSARRRWEATGFSGSETAAPQITRTTAIYSKKCFSL